MTKKEVECLVACEKNVKKLKSNLSRTILYKQPVLVDEQPVLVDEQPLLADSSVCTKEIQRRFQSYSKNESSNFDFQIVFLGIYMRIYFQIVKFKQKAQTKPESDYIN